MRIGKLVIHHIEKIFRYCEDVDPSELKRLTNRDYSNETFGINFPFCKEASLISEKEHNRYWAKPSYQVEGKIVRVTSQWAIHHKQRFIDYIVDKGISDRATIKSLIDADENTENSSRSSTRTNSRYNRSRSSTRVNSRYKGNAIGNAQNGLVRTILSNLGEESFSEEHWKNTMSHFHNKCAYCGSEEEIVMDHVVPINRKSLGEHRLGNLVPSCKSCNSKKGNKDYKVFLEGKKDRMSAISKYMEDNNYKPLGDNKEVAMLLEMAYKEVAIVSNRYIEILNTIMQNK